MQTPSISRILHFYSRQPLEGGGWSAPDGPHTAIVTKVHGVDMVNLRVIPDEGTIERQTSVEVFETPEAGAAGHSSQYCCWPPRVS